MPRPLREVASRPADDSLFCTDPPGPPGATAWSLKGGRGQKWVKLAPR